MTYTVCVEIDKERSGVVCRECGLKSEHKDEYIDALTENNWQYELDEW